MSNTKLSTEVQLRLKSIYENYKLGYVGIHFSESFQILIRDLYTTFEHLPPVAHTTTIRRPIGDITYRTFLEDGQYIFFVESYIPNPTYYSTIQSGSERERRTKRIRRAPSVRASRKDSYVYSRKGGTLNGIDMEIVKRNVSKNGTPRYVENYRYIKNGKKHILSRTDFRSANAFINNQADAWKCNGQRVVIDSTWLNESKIPNRIITETELKGIIKECIIRVLYG